MKLSEKTLSAVTTILAEIAQEHVDRIYREMPALDQGETTIDENFDHGVYTRLTRRNNGEVTETTLNTNIWNEEGANYIDKRVKLSAGSICS